MKLAKKTLSLFLSLLMIFSACSVGLTGITASAAAEDSAYTADEVVALINAATAGGFTLSSSGDEWKYYSDDGKVIAAAEAIFDYALNAYREGKEPTSKGNSTKALYDAFKAEFQSKYTNAAAADKLVKNILDPEGTIVYAYGEGVTKTTKLDESETSYGNNVDVTETFPITSYPGYYAAGNVTKTVEISLDLNKYLMTFATIEDIPSTVIKSVNLTYAHGAAGTATATETSRTEGSSCNKKTYYTTTINTTSFNYMPSKPNRQVVKDKTIKKTLLTAEKYFNAELLSTTKADMLAMSATDIKTLYDTTELMYASVEAFSDTVLAHFGLNPSAIHQFMDDVYFAYRVVAGKTNIDNLNTLIGSSYNTESYAEMSRLYAKTNTAYNVVYSMDQEIIDYIVGEGGYSEQYESAMALKATAKSYNATLFDIMTEQKLEETVASMVATYNQYFNALNKEDIENPSDAEVIGLDQKVKAFDSIIASYTSKSYFRNYWTTAYESEWGVFKSKLAEVYEVRGLKTSFQTQYDYFLPIIYTTKIDELDNASAIALHSELDTKLAELSTTYNEVVAEWGGTIANKIFTINYEGNDYLLQNLIDSVKSTGKEAVKNVLIARTEAQLDAVYAYKDTTVVNFDNFASIKSTLTYFDYDLYNYVVDNNLGLSTEYKNKYSMVQTLLDRYHAFSTTDGKAFFDEDFTYADANGNYATRYAGSQYDSEGNQIGYPADIARSGAEDNYVVSEDKLLDTIVKIDGFITSRDFGAIVGLVDNETDEYTDLATYIEQMLNEMLYTDDLINTLVGAIYPMIVDLLNTELIGMLADMGTNDNPAASACIDIGEMTGGDGSGHLYVYMDDDLFNGQHKQRNLDEVLADAGLYVYPQTLADSLLMSNPVAFGVGTPIYTALKEAGRDWTKLVCEDNPETELVDETKILEFEWGVYDSETFVDTLGCIFDSLLPLLNAVLTGTAFNETLANAAYAYSTDTKYIVNVGKLAVFGDLNLQIPGLTVFNDVLVPLFEILGVDKIPTLKSGASGDQIAKAIVVPLLGVIDEVLANPLSTVLEILPNLVYFLSMDSVQEILNSLNINLHLKIEAEVDKENSGTLVDLLGGTLLSLLGDKLSFDVELKISDLLDLYDLLGFEISDFNEILKFALSALSAPPEEGAEEGGLNLGIDLSGLKLPPIKQQEIIFCSDWTTNAAGRVDLEANKGDLIYWFLNYVISALVPDENGNSLLTSLLGSDMDPMISGIIEKVVYQITGNQNGALAAIIELLNPVEYDLGSMEWLESTFDYNGIEGADQMSIVYLNYGNDWTKEKSEYILDNADTLVNAVLEMLGNESMDLGAFLQEKVGALFTNANITALVEMLGGLGDSPSAIIADILGEQIGIKLDTWFTAFGYLYPAETWAEDAEIIPLGHRNYVNNFGVEGVANEDGTISWSFNKIPLNDGDAYTFVNILTRLLGGASKLVEFLLAGGDLAAFNGLITLKGYETYATSLGLVFEMLGVENIPTQADFNADAMGSLNNMLTAVLDWFYALTDSDDMIAQLVEVIPNIFYFIESNGLSTLLRNLLQPVWVLVDTVRPLIDVDVNGVLSLVVSEFINYGTLDINVILEYVLHGIYMNEDVDFVWYNVDLFNLTFSEIIKIVDAALGTNLYNSGLVQVGVKGFCSGLEKIENTAVGTVYKPTIDAADTITILVTALLDCLDYPAADTSKTNGDAIFALIAELTENEEIAGYYPVIKEVIKGVEVTYTEPNWGYMFKNADDFSLTLPEQSIVYLGYSTDWDKETADTVYDALDDILNMILPEVLEEGETLATLLNGLLEDNVYSDEILNTVVELVVNAISMLDGSLRDLIDVAVATDIAAWFAMCTLNEETGEYECTKDWGIDAAAEADKKDLFIAALKEVLTPANSLLAFVFFGEEFAFFTGSEKNENGEYTYNDIIKLNGGEGYAYGIAPILEALGCEMKPASAYYDEAAGTYNVANAVEDILKSVLALVDTITANPVEEVFKLLPNLIYFINADGLVSSVNNLLAPINGIIEKLSPLVGGASLGALLEETIGLNIENIATETLLQIAADNGVKLSAEMVDIICNLYVGKLVEFTAANGNKAYRLDVTGAEGDVLTIVLCIALDLFNLNNELFSDLLGAETYAAIVTLIKGLDVDLNYIDIDWAYMYEGDFDKLDADGFPEQTIVYLGYANDWDEKAASSVYSALDEILELVLDSTLEDGENIKTLIEGLLNDNVYSDDVLNSLVELIVNGLANLDAAIYEAAGAVLDADIATWFSFCELNADGEYVCTKDWGVDEATDKKAAFVAGIKEVLEPANKLLSWLFFGEKYTLFNGTTNEVLVTINGGHGYAYGLVPIFEALGCTMQPESAFKNADGTYNVGNAVESILDAALALVDDISGNAIEEVFELLPNLIYFINAGGLKAAVNNLLAPVNAVVECLNPVIGDFSIGALLTDLAGFDICNITVDTLLAFAADYGVVVNDDMAYVLNNLYVGKPTAYTSSNGKTAYRVEYTDDAQAYDMLTILLGIAIDAFNLNADLFSDLLGAEVYYAVYELIKGAQDEFVYRDMNWSYMYDGEDADSKLFNEGFPVRDGDAYTVYTQYKNNWNNATAEYLDSVLDTLVKDITAAAADGSTLGKLVEDAIADGLYQDDILNSLIELVVELLVDYEDIIVQAGALIDAEGLAVWFDEYCEITTDENGETVVTCVKDWGVDAAETNEAKRTAFVEGFVEALRPAYRLLAWLLFEEDFEFLNGTTNSTLITIKGGKGYETALIPLLEGVSATMNYEGTASGIKPAAAFYDADGNLDMEMAVRDVFTAIADWLYVICGDIASGEGTLSTMLDYLPTLIYFVNADGLKVVVNNLLQPVNFVLDKLQPMGVELDFSTIVEGVDITNFDFYEIFVLLEDLLDLYFPEYAQDFLATFYMGKPVAYTSANGNLAYRMEYTDAESRKDMITVLISFVVDVFQDPRNDARLIDWLGEDVYKSIIEVLKITEPKPMQDFSWYYTEYANTGKIFTPVETSEVYTATYNKYWTKDKAQYLADNLESFIANILHVAKFEIGGTKVESIEDLLDVLVGTNLYTQANADAIIAALKDVISMLTDLEPYGEYIATVLKTALDVDIHAWDNMTVTVVDGDRESFSDALGTILAPAVPLLKLLLTSEDFRFFYTIDGSKEDALVIYGSEGYAYGIVPLLEALGCTSVLTPAEYKAGIEKDPANAIKGIIDPLFDRIDAIAADPLNEIVNMLPAVVYFINSNGLDTVVKNLVNSIDTVLIALEPLVGVTSIVDLLGVDLATYDFNYLFNMLVENVEESTGFELEVYAANAVNELTTGTVVSYESKNGETYYTMKYASETDKADMITIILRLILDFVTADANIEAFEVMLAEYIPDEDAHKTVCSLLEAIADTTKEDPGLGKGMAVLYYFFFTMSETAEGADDMYHDITNSWEFILKMLDTSKEPLINEFGNNLKKALNNNFGTNYETTEKEDKNPEDSGIVTLFDKIAEFFKKIGEFFKKLFGIG